MALQNNISGELTKKLLAAGDKDKISSISLVNVHADGTICTVDLFIEKKITGKFYIAKSIALPAGVTLMFKGADFSSASNGFDLFIKLTKSASETPAVDVIIS